MSEKVHLLKTFPVLIVKLFFPACLRLYAHTQSLMKSTLKTGCYCSFLIAFSLYTLSTRPFPRSTYCTARQGTGIGTLIEDEDDIKRESFFKRFREDELDGLVNKLICPVAAENPIISKRNCLYKIWHKI